MKDKILYNGLTRFGMIYQIHMECDSSGFCYRMSDDELIECYKDIFERTSNESL